MIKHESFCCILVSVLYLWHKIVPSCSIVCFNKNAVRGTEKTSSMKPETESKNIMTVRRLYEASGNPNIVNTLLAPDVCWEVVEGFPYSGIYQGPNGVFDFFTRLFGDFEDWHTEPADIFGAGDRVIGLGFYSAHAKATGKSFKARFAHVWTMRDGVIIRLQQCADTVQLAKALRQDFSGEQKPK
jgi:ketosteroid isomerase-like protein